MVIEQPTEVVQPPSLRSSPNPKRKLSETDDKSSLAELIISTGESVSSSSDVNKIVERRKSVQFALERNEYIVIERNLQSEPHEQSVMKKARLKNEIERPTGEAEKSVPKTMKAVILNQILDRSCDTAAVISEFAPILHEIAESSNFNDMTRTQTLTHADRFNDDINRTRADIQMRSMKAKVDEIQKMHATELENMRAYYESKIAATAMEHNLQMAGMKSKQWCQSCGEQAPSTYCCDPNCREVFE